MPQIDVESFEVLKDIFYAVSRATEISYCEGYKKRFQNENLKQIAGKGTINFFIIEKRNAQMKHFLNLFSLIQF